MTDDERRRKLAELDALADEARRAAKECPLNDRMSRRIEASAPLPLSALKLPPWMDPGQVTLSRKMRFANEYEVAEELVRAGQMLPPDPPPYSGRTWRHHVWDMLKDAWAFCTGRRL